VEDHILDEHIVDEINRKTIKKYDLWYSSNKFFNMPISGIVSIDTPTRPTVNDLLKVSAVKNLYDNFKQALEDSFQGEKNINQMVTKQMNKYSKHVDKLLDIVNEIRNKRNMEKSAARTIQLWYLERLYSKIDFVKSCRKGFWIDNNL
jgi:hypothetical protein